MKTFPQKVITFPQTSDYLPSNSWNVLQNDFLPPKYVDLRALLSIVASRIYALFDAKSTSLPNLGAGREGG